LYFGLVILIALADVAMTLVTSTAALLGTTLGVVGDASLAGSLERIVGPMIVAIPVAVAGWFHWAYRRREAASRGPVTLADTERVALQLAALVGLTFLSAGVAGMLGRMLERVMGAGAVDELLRVETAWFVAQMLVGAALWVPAWASILRRRAADPHAEHPATSTRAYFYLVIGAALIAAVPSAALVLFRIIDTLLGGGSPGLVSELTLPIAILVVAGVVGGYHGQMVVADLRAAAAEAPSAPVAPPAVPAATAGPATALATAGVPSTGPVAADASLDLVLRGTGGTDLVAVAEGLRRHLPPGVVLEGSRPRANGLTGQAGSPRSVDLTGQADSPRSASQPS
jgi:hypothetical protein